MAVEACPGGVVVPLASFDPTAIPDPQGKQVVFACRSGKRSVTASLAAQAAGLPYDRHLAGGMLAWKAARFPTRTRGSRSITSMNKGFADLPLTIFQPLPPLGRRNNP